MTEHELEHFIDHELNTVIAAARRVLADVERCRAADVLTIQQGRQLRSMERLAKEALAAALEYRETAP